MINTIEYYLSQNMWSCHCDNVDGLSGYKAKGNKSDWEQKLP